VWEPNTVWCSGDAAFRGRGVSRKHTTDAGLEAAKLSWLGGQGMPAAEVLDVDDDRLVTREIVGRTGAEFWPEDQLARPSS